MNTYEMEIRVSEVTPVTIVGANKAQKRTVVGTEDTKFDPDRAFVVWGRDACAAVGDLREGDIIKVMFNVRGHIWKDRVFTDLGYRSHEVIHRAETPGGQPFVDMTHAFDDAPAAETPPF